MVMFDTLFSEPIREVDRLALIRELKEAGTPLLQSLGARLESNHLRIIWMPQPPKPKLPELIAGERL